MSLGGGGVMGKGDVKDEGRWGGRNGGEKWGRERREIREEGGGGGEGKEGRWTGRGEGWRREGGGGGSGDVRRRSEGER